MGHSTSSSRSLTSSQIKFEDTGNGNYRVDIPGVGGANIHAETENGVTEYELEVWDKNHKTKKKVKSYMPRRVVEAEARAELLRKRKK